MMTLFYSLHAKQQNTINFSRPYRITPYDKGVLHLLPRFTLSVINYLKHVTIISALPITGKILPHHNSIYLTANLTDSTPFVNAGLPVSKLSDLLVE